MNEKELEKFKRNMGMPKEYKIGEDMFTFQPLDCDLLPDFIEIQGIVASAKSDVAEVIMLPENFKKVIALTKKFVKKSYPELPDEVVGGFVSKNMVELFNILGDINSSSNDSADVQEKIKQIQEANAKV